MGLAEPPLGQSGVVENQPMAKKEKKKMMGFGPWGDWPWGGLATFKPVSNPLKKV